MTVQTTSSLSANMHLYYVKSLLDVLQPRLAFYPLGEKTKLPKGTGKQVKWLRYTKFNANTTALTEGIVPQASTATTQNVTATISQYGDYYKVSDLLSTTAIDDTIEEHSKLAGAAAAETIEALIAAELDASGVAQYGGGAANLNAVTGADTPVMKDFIKAQLTQRKNLVGPHRMGKFMVVLAPSHRYDLVTEQNLGGWLDINQYSLADKKALLDTEVGQAYGMRFLESDKATSATNSGNVVVWNSYVIGERAFGVVELSDKSFQIIVKDASSGGVANPLNQFSTIGWKIMGFVPKYLGGSSNGTADRVTLIRAATALS
jgi:N4-gp56 family major capsid protein